MENWIGVGIWIVLGGFIGYAMKAVTKVPEEQPGHNTILVLFGAFGAVVGGMLGVGLFHFPHPSALSVGGMLSAVFLAGFMAWLYRLSIRVFI